MRWILFLVVLAGCPSPFSPRTLVYAFDEGDPVPRLDDDTCVRGVGLRVPLGITESIAFDITSADAAALASCDLEGSDVLACGRLEPEIPLTLTEDLVTGVGSVHGEFEDTDCTGATLESSWTITLDEEARNFDATVVVEWILDDTPECDRFEAEILDANPGNGRVDGCLIRYDFTGSQVAECRLDAGFLVCQPPE